MASLLKPRTSTAVALLGRNDGARAQLRQSLEELGASVVFEGDTAGSAANDVLEHGPRVVIVNLAENADDELDHLQPVFDAPDVDVVFNESGVSSQLKGWDLARWARHLAAKVLGAGDTMPPPPPGAEALPLHDLVPTPGAPPTPAQLAGERPIEEFVMEAEDRVDAVPEDFLPMADHAAAAPLDDFIDADTAAIVDLDDAGLQDALTQVPATPVPPSIVRAEREPELDEDDDAIHILPLPDLGELDRAIEADAQTAAAPTRSDQELLDEALGGLDLNIIAAPAHDAHADDGRLAPPPQHAPDAFAELLASDAPAPIYERPPPEQSIYAQFADVTEFSVAADASEETAATDDAPAASAAAVTVPFGALYLESDDLAADNLDGHTLPADDAARATRDAVSAGEDETPALSQTLSPEWQFDDTLADADSDATAPATPTDAAAFDPAIFDLAGYADTTTATDGASAVDDSGMAVEELDIADIAGDFGFDLPRAAAPAPAAQQTAPPAVEDATDFTLADDFDTIDLSDADLLTDDDTDPAPAADRSTPSWNHDTDNFQYDDSLTLDDDVAALAAQLDAMEQDAPDRAQPQEPAFANSSLTMEPMRVDDDDSAPAPAPAAPVAATPAPDIDFGGLSLTSMDEDIEAAPRVALAANFDFSGIDSLSLEPIEDETAEAASADAAGADPLLMAMGLVDAPPKNQAVDGIPRVIVLGASIGGPDALRTFLAGIPANFPALFLLVQHLENGYFERLAQQLQKATKLKVRSLVPDGPFAAAGEVLVVPASARFAVERNGHIEATPHETPPRYTPCIDDVLRDAADRFGAHTTAIIFSGMAGDAIDGAVYVTGKGGEVWVQDPASCVVSSMVDGARARGVVEFIGSPRELAERCVALYGN